MFRHVVLAESEAARHAQQEIERDGMAWIARIRPFGHVGGRMNVDIAVVRPECRPAHALVLFPFDQDGQVTSGPKPVQYCS